MSVGISLRRAGHEVTVYERHDFAGEVGASVSCAANGTRWLHEWGVDIAKGDPVILKKLINRDWKTGEPVSVYDLDDYEKKWGYVYNMFHRQYMHTMLKDCALDEEGEGTPAKLLVNYQVSIKTLSPATQLELTSTSAKALIWDLELLRSKTVTLHSMISLLGLMASVPWFAARLESTLRSAQLTPAVYMQTFERKTLFDLV